MPFSIEKGFFLILAKMNAKSVVLKCWKNLCVVKPKFSLSLCAGGIIGRKQRIAIYRVRHIMDTYHEQTTPKVDLYITPYLRRAGLDNSFSKICVKRFVWFKQFCCLLQNAHDQTLLPGGGGLLCWILSSDLLISYQLLGLYQNRRKDLAKVNITLFIKDNSSYTYEEAKVK